jgi:hypothetical protein
LHQSILKSTRRRWLALSLVAPMLISGTALADDDQDFRPDRRPGPPGPAALQPARLEAFGSDLVTLSQSASNGDFGSGNAGSDALTGGRVSLARRGGDSSEGRADVVLRGAAANVSYDVFFEPFSTGKGREALGTIGPTNDAGNLNAQTPNALSGSSRVGMFVIARTSDGSGQAGKDEFVSSLGG